MRSVLAAALGLAAVLSLVTGTPEVHAQANGPMIISGLAPDAFGHFDTDTCLACTNDRLVQGLCDNQCSTCRDGEHFIFAGDSSTAGCATYNDDKTTCRMAWQRNQVGLALSCFYDDATDLCAPCTADGELNATCDEVCSRCADETRNILAGGSFPDSCRAFDGNETNCNAAYQVDGFSTARVSCFYDGATNECHACGVAEQLSFACTNTCSVCTDENRTSFAAGPGDGCPNFDDDDETCEATWGYSAGFVPTSCFFTDGSDQNQGGFLFIQDGFDRLAPLVTNGKTLAVCIGCNGTTALEGFVGGFTKSILPGLGWTREIINDPVDIAAFLDGSAEETVADAGIVYMPSEQTDGPHFGIGPDQIAVLNANAAALASFVGAGGGIFALNQTRSPGGFEWLKAILPDFAKRYGGTCTGEPALTPAGQGTFPNVTPEILEDTDNDGSGYFLGFGGLAVLATQSCHDVTCKDPEHQTFAGGPSNDICPAISEEPTCDASWYITQGGVAAPCSFVNGELEMCIGCGRNEQGEDPCTNTCQGCDDPARTGRVDSCEQIPSEDEATCGISWQFDFGGVNGSCFFDEAAGFCRVCNAENERLGLCTNVCEPPAAARAVVIGIGGVAEPTSTPVSTSTPQPTSTPEPTATVEATAEATTTPEPTGTPSATETAAPVATETATPEVTATLTPVPTTSPTPVAAGPLRSFQCYAVQQGPFTTIPDVQLADQFGSGMIDLRRTRRLCAPADVGGTDPGAPSDARHLLGYNLHGRAPRFQPVKHVAITNVFGTIDADVLRPVLLYTPTRKSLEADPGPPPADLDHFQCYAVEGARQRASDLAVVDQFGNLSVDVKKPLWLCAPADKNGGGIVDGSRGLMCYRVRNRRPPQFPGRDPVFVHDQFGPREVRMQRPTELCIPSTIGGGSGE